ncbi:MAG TPA: alkaline phosphatase D family protein [Rhizomicrobium sp.]|jgi:alkaline phosphatase D|nr:alkaline phosphatase D family protein [Rhizomicrobium sp.]
MAGHSRREILAAAAALGASAAFAGAARSGARSAWRENRQMYPQGVASGDPDMHSVLLWTRRPYPDGHGPAHLKVEVAEDAEFARVVAVSRANCLPVSDWTVRVLVGGLKPGREYWYRFTDAQGNGSRIGRTLTAPAQDDTRAVRFAFVSCQNANLGAQNAYRRMIYEDERAAPEDRLGFVLHLGDFIYELSWYPEDRPKGYYTRHINDVVRYPHGEKIGDFHVPTDVGDYRAAYDGYLRDPDLQDARARFAFVTIWDNHEFSWQGWQSFQAFDGKTRPAQAVKVAAMQAWFEYHPARVTKPSPSLDRFDPPAVSTVPITKFDDNGMGDEPNNRAALASLTGYRALRWGPHVDLIITDQRSYRSEEPTGRDEAGDLVSDDFPRFLPEESQRILDGGRDYNGGHPPATIAFNGKIVPNFRKDAPPQTVLGAVQRAWFMDRLKASTATWKIWGNTTALIDMRTDAQNLPATFPKHWPSTDYAGFGGGEACSAYVERDAIYDMVAREGITGFASVCGDRHSFWAGLAAKALPPRPFEPVGVTFVTGSISAPGLAEAVEFSMKTTDPTRPLFVAERADGSHAATINLTVHHGVRSALEYAASGDIAKARALSNPDNAPHVAFADMGGHGYAVVRAASDALSTEFVCIPRPIDRSTAEDGGPLRYRVIHTAKLWGKGERPVLEQRVVEGDAELSV